jgi:Domain of unknown function (DUF5753)
VTGTSPAARPVQPTGFLKLVADWKVTVQITPFEAGAYVAADGYFMLLEFTEGRNLWQVVFIEGLAGNQYLGRRADIARYREAIDYLRSCALSLSDSTKLMTKVRNVYANEEQSGPELIAPGEEGMCMSAAGDLEWRGSDTCNDDEYVQVVRTGDIVIIDNANKPNWAFINFTSQKWRQFLPSAKRGDFDRTGKTD